MGHRAEDPEQVLGAQVQGLPELGQGLPSRWAGRATALAAAAAAKRGEFRDDVTAFHAEDIPPAQGSTGPTPHSPWTSGSKPGNPR